MGCQGLLLGSMPLSMTWLAIVFGDFHPSVCDALWSWAPQDFCFRMGQGHILNSSGVKTPNFGYLILKIGKFVESGGVT